MSSMVSHRLSVTLLISTVVATTVVAQTVSIPVVQPVPANKPAAPLASIPMVGGGSEWDEARERLRQSASSEMAMAIARWKILSRTDTADFASYSSFVLSYPGLPLEERMRRNAEKALDREGVDPARVVAFFDRRPPLTNPGRAHYAQALAALGKREARTQALLAWRGGAMGDQSEAALAVILGGATSPDDQDARMDALLWAGSTAQAQRQIARVSASRRALFEARLAALTGNDPETLSTTVPTGAQSDPGWLYNRARQLRRLGQNQAAASLLATRGALRGVPLDPEKWVDLQLDAAKDTDMRTAIQIASRIDDGFAPGTDISKLGYTLRDEYTSLMWLAGMGALKQVGDPRSAAPLFWRYGTAARTPQTRAKGLYWAGRALVQAGDSEGARRYFAGAAVFPDQFYGMLSRERLGQSIPTFDKDSKTVPSAAERAAFNARPLTAAVREVARESDWSTAVRFFREIAEQAQSESDHVLVADLARQLGRRDLGVILGQAAHADGLGNFQRIAFPLIPVPQGSDWTMIHAISRQESQFATNAISHAGARGLMQLMPGTARGEATRVGLSYDAQALGDPGYNLRLGGSYIQRMVKYYGGSYPLAIAAYNAGPGNVNKWLAANGDPRTGAIDWIDWIERIPFTETRGYVQHVMENMVVYEAMNPDQAKYSGPNPLSHFLGRRTAG